MKPSYEELEVKLIQAEAAICELRDINAKLLGEINRLKDQLNKNSKNSSKPPSTDQKSNTSTHPKNKKKRKGIHKLLYPKERISHFVTCTLEKCPHCQSKELIQQENPHIIQQAELPEIEAVITQYDCFKYKCTKCQRQTTAPLPKGIQASSFGPRVKALTTCLTGRFHLAKREAKLLIKELCNIDIAEGSIINIEQELTKSLEAIHRRIHRYTIGGSHPRYLDETTWRDQGKRHYVWICTGVEAAYYHIDRHRSQKALTKLIESHTDPPTVTDRYGAYAQIKGPHQYCLAHLIRDFRLYAEQSGEDGRIGQLVVEEIQSICKQHKNWRENKITRMQYAARMNHHKRHLRRHFIEGMALGSDKLAGLCERIDDRHTHLFTFTKIKGMEPTNNLAERDLRKLVIWRKKSYGTRSEKGKSFVTRVTTVIETLKKHEKSPFKFLEEAITAYHHKKLPPQIAPGLGF